MTQRETVQYPIFYINMKGYFADIDNIIEEAKKMGQYMENGLRNRKEFMVKKGIEDEYQK